MKLSKEQEKAIKHTDGPALVLAVPGAGKTTVLIHRTVNLILNHNVLPSQILSITFSKSSALDMKARFVNSFPNISSRLVEFSTIHSFCFKILRDYAHMKKVRYSLIEDSRNKINKYSLLKNIYLSVNKGHITEEKLENLLNAIGYIKNMMIDGESFLKENKIEIDNFQLIFNQYEKYKKENNLIDFDDMLSKTLEILSKEKNILDKYRKRYLYIQLDEGQDTSKVQMEIVKLLAYPKNNIFIVADDDQSIYGFRGADPQALLDFQKKYENGKLFFMQTNYRSSKNIVSVCNKFIKNNETRYDKDIQTDNDYLQPINIVKVNNIREQYKLILDDIKNRNFKNSCILYRNNLSSIGLIELFEREGIPFYMKDTKLKFFNHWIIRDIINFIKFSKDTSNLNLYESIYYKTKGYISKKQINYARKLNSQLSVFDRISDYPGIPEYYKKRLRELTLDFKKLSNLSPRESIDYIEYNLEYDKYLKENCAKFGFTYENLKTILFYLKFISEKTANLDDLLLRLDHLQSLTSKSSQNNDGITLSTVHSAKGLEFDRVYIINLVDGDFPSMSSLDEFEKGNPSLLEEERRLFYVAMSRAKYHLSLITVKYLGNKIALPSQFLKELE